MEKLGAEHLGKIFSEVSEISENSGFSISPCRPHPVEAAYRVFLVLLNSKALNQGTVSAVASVSKTHLSIHGKSTPCSSNSIYTTNSINLPQLLPVPW